MGETMVARYALLQVAGDAIMVTAVHGRLVRWNPAAERLLGCTAAEAVGSALARIIPERFRAWHWTGYQAVMQTGQTR
jgi:PAS domain S-box-containing protein